MEKKKRNAKNSHKKEVTTLGRTDPLQSAKLHGWKEDYHLKTNNISTSGKKDVLYYWRVNSSIADTKIYCRQFQYMAYSPSLSNSSKSRIEILGIIRCDLVLIALIHKVPMQTLKRQVFLCCIHRHNLQYTLPRRIPSHIIRKKPIDWNKILKKET